MEAIIVAKEQQEDGSFHYNVLTSKGETVFVQADNSDLAVRFAEEGSHLVKPKIAPSVKKEVVAEPAKPKRKKKVVAKPKGKKK